MSSVEFYELSLFADKDLEDIFDYTLEKFGEKQAISYVSSFVPLFEQLVKNLSIGRQRDEIKKGLMSIPHEEHLVFFRILRNHIRIVRVLHGSRDITNFL